MYPFQIHRTSLGKPEYFFFFQLIIKYYLIINIYNQILRKIVAQNELSDKNLTDCHQQYYYTFFSF